MSTKLTISYNKYYHLYQVMFDDENIHIELKNIKFDYSNKYNESSINISIDHELWKTIMSEYEKNKDKFMHNDYNEIEPHNIDLFSMKDDIDEK